MAQPAALPFLARFTALQDPRQAAKVLYPLPELLLLLLCGTVADADDFVELALWSGEHLPFLRRFCRSRAAFRAMTRCAKSSRPSTRHCSRAASRTGSSDRAIPGRRRSRSTARPRGAAMPGPRAAARCIRFRPGRSARIGPWRARMAVSKPVGHGRHGRKPDRPRRQDRA